METLDVEYMCDCTPMSKSSINESDTLTFKENTVGCRHKGPDIRGPVRMVKPSSEWEQAAEQLRELAH